MAESVQATGIEELDSILNGGVPRGHVVLLAGDSGTGKTILSTEWLFRGYELFDEPGLYLTLTETITSALDNIEALSFYDEAAMSGGIHFSDLRSTLSLLDLDEEELDKDDVEDILDTIQELVTETGAKRVALDSVTALAYLLRDRHLIRYFVFRLGAILDSMDCTMFMTSEVSGEGYSVYGVEEFISDGIIKLRQAPLHHDRERSLQVIKMRGRDYDASEYTFNITPDGIDLLRVEAPLTYSSPTDRISIGVPGLDELCGDGIFDSSISLVSGPAGSGKTLLSMHFLNEALANGSNALYVGFEESDDQFLRNADYFNIPIRDHAEDGDLQLVTGYPETRFPMEHLVNIVRIIQQHDIGRVAIDPVSALRRTFPDDDYARFARRAVSVLKNDAVSGLVTASTPHLMGSQRITEGNLSTLTDNIFLLKYAETEGRLSRVLSVLKTRGTDHDNRLWQYYITGEGMDVGEPVSAFEGVFSGTPRKIGATVRERLEDLFIEELGPMGRQEFQQLAEQGLDENRVNRYVNGLIDRGVLPAEHADTFMADIERVMDGEPLDRREETSAEQKHWLLERLRQ